jgi:hypothetical protein
VQGRTYNWSIFTRRADFPMYSTSAVRTGLMNDAATLTAKIHVRLKRVRPGPVPDKTVWEYKQRSRTFQCDPSDFG